MTRILRIDASARTKGSVTRRMADEFLGAWQRIEPAAAVVHRDVGSNPPPIISEEWIAACFAKQTLTAEQRMLLAVSDQLIDELEAADVLVMTTPMYNYGMPAALKAWFDQVVRINRTFSFDLARGDRPLQPLMNGKTLVLLTSWGEFGFEPGGINDGSGHLVPHIRTASRYLGVESIEHIGVQFQEFGDYRYEASMAAAFDAIPELVNRLATSHADAPGEALISEPHFV